MTWDGQNRMTACTANGSTATFTSGADGLRRSMTTGGVTTYYVYDGQSMVREMQGAPGSLHATATYLTGPRGPEYRRDDTQTEPDGQGHTYGVTRWYVYDGLGSVVGEVDPLGNLTANSGYDVYGAKRVTSGTASSKQGFVGSLGHVTDDTGLVYMRARYYDPQTGRFQSEDPDAHGVNWFIYCHNNPINKIDQSGRDDFSLGSLVSGMAEGAGLDADISSFGLQTIKGSLTTEPGTAAIYIDMIEATNPGTMKVGQMLSALRSWGTAQGINKLIIGGIGGSEAGDGALGTVLKMITRAGDTGELQEDGPVTWLYWTLKNE